MQTKALVLSGYGINCEQETAYAIRKVGGSTDIVHVNELIENPTLLQKYNFFVVPGGFSFGDDLGSGKVLANKMKFKLKDSLQKFIEDGNLILGICNGFQVLVKLGILPIPDFKQRVTLKKNESGKFEDRWVWLKVNAASPCIFTRDLGYFPLPVRHGEGNFFPESEDVLKEIIEKNLHVIQYVNEKGNFAGYPWNPNGSIANIAGICDPSGRIFGMMPHPEAFHDIHNCPYWKITSVKEALGLRIFRNAVEWLAR